MTPKEIQTQATIMKLDLDALYESKDDHLDSIAACYAWGFQHGQEGKEKELEQADYQISLQNNEIIDKALQIKELKEKVEQNNDVGKLANFLQKVIKEQMLEIETLKKELSDAKYFIDEQSKLLNASADRNFELNKENKNLTENYHNRLLDIDEIKRQWRDDRNQRKNESLK